jgi:3-phenylpropionate/trans-cinnamate dioxygenase ferredoxin reductase component
MQGQQTVVLGAGLAGATAALTLRERGFEGGITLIGQEAHPPYHRPPLSKGYLRGEEAFPDQLVAPEADYAARGIELRLNARATRIDPRGQVVELEDRERIPYDRLLVATGGRNRRLSVPGADLDGVLQLRTVGEADRIRAAARPGARAVLVGMGFIGSEVAASLRQLGVEVTVVEGARTPLARVLGERVGRVLADIHRERGVELVLEDSVEAFEGHGRVERVRTGRGRTIDCDLVIAGIGIVPNSEVLELAGAAVENGVLVDERCRTTLPGVFAAGDVANHRHPVFGRVRVEHWNNADQMGRAVAGAMLGDEAPYAYIHSFWSDQYDHSLEYAGHATSWDEVVLRGDPASRRFLAFYVRGGVLLAAFGLNRGGDPEDPNAEGELKACVPLIREHAAVDAKQLADEAFDLRGVVTGGRVGVRPPGTV